MQLPVSTGFTDMTVVWRPINDSTCLVEAAHRDISPCKDGEQARACLLAEAFLDLVWFDIVKFSRPHGRHL